MRWLMITLSASVLAPAFTIAARGEPALEMLIQSGHTEKIYSVAFSGDARRVLTGSGDNSAILWDADTGQKLRTFQSQAVVNSGSLSRDGKRVLTGSHDKPTVLWDADGGQKLRTFVGNTDRITTVSLSGDGKRVLTGSSDGTTRLWDAQNGAELCRLISIDAGADWLVATPDGYFDGSVHGQQFVSYRLTGRTHLSP